MLGGLTPAHFMRRHWQREPLLVRQAWPQAPGLVQRSELFTLATREDVESRLVIREPERWRVRHGPIARRALPALSRPGWTLLVQGVDRQVHAARQLLDRFDFIPAARLDDLMVSWASPGGGVGPHIDSYDVFLIQIAGCRRWRIGPATDTRLVEGAPLKILRHFQPEQDWLLEPGDMLYLPPRWAHDGLAEGGPCVTASVGFRAPRRASLASELLLRLADSAADDEPNAQTGSEDRDLYRDAGQAATTTPAAVPRRLQQFAERALRRVLEAPDALPRALGEVLSEPKPGVWFDAEPTPSVGGPGPWHLAPGTRMLYDERHVFINGESFLAAGRDAMLLRALADTRRLPGDAYRRLSPGARGLLDEWVAQGWLLATPA